MQLCTNLICIYVYVCVSVSLCYMSVREKNGTSVSELLKVIVYDCIHLYTNLICVHIYICMCVCIFFLCVHVYTCEYVYMSDGV